MSLVIGGEPFINRELDKILSLMVSYEHLQNIVIYTNAQHIPTGNTLEVLKNPKIKLDITNYRKVNRSAKHDRLIKVLQENNINYVYLEMVDFESLNELYNTLDLYIVTSRIEGGPQSIVECGLSKTPIISTDVGIASAILDKQSIFDMNNFLSAEPNVEVAYTNSHKLVIPKGFNKFLELFKSLVIK